MDLDINWWLIEMENREDDWAAVKWLVVVMLVLLIAVLAMELI